MDKWFAKSKTIWGLAIAGISTILPFFGIGISAEEVSTLNVSFDTIGQLIGLLIALYGRIKATGGLTLT